MTELREAKHSTRSGVPFLPGCFGSLSRVGSGSLLPARLLVNLRAGVSLEERLCLPHGQVKVSVVLRVQANACAPSLLGLGTFSLCLGGQVRKRGIRSLALWLQLMTEPRASCMLGKHSATDLPPRPGILFSHLFSTSETQLLGWIQTKVDFHPWTLCPRLWVTLSPLATAAAVLAMGRKLKATSWGGD